MREKVPQKSKLSAVKKENNITAYLIPNRVCITVPTPQAKSMLPSNSDVTCLFPPAQTIVAIIPGVARLELNSNR